MARLQAYLLLAGASAIISAREFETPAVLVRAATRGQLALARLQAYLQFAAANAVLFLSIVGLQAYLQLATANVVLPALRLHAYLRGRGLSPVRNTVLAAMESSLVSAVSNEFRGTFLSIQGSWELVADGYVKHGSEEFRRVRANIDRRIERFNLLVDQLEALEQLRSGTVELQFDRLRVGDAMERIGIGVAALNGQIEMGEADEQTLDSFMEVDHRWVARSITGIHRSIRGSELGGTRCYLTISQDDGRAKITLNYPGLRSDIAPRQGPLSEAESERLGVSFSLAWQVADRHEGRVVLEVPSGIRDRITVTFDLPLHRQPGRGKPGPRRPDAVEESFLRALSHELRAPMSSFQGPWGLVADGLVKYGDTELQRMEFLRVRRSIDHGIRRFMALADDLEALAMLGTKRVSLNIEQVQVRRLLDEVVESVQPIISVKQQSVQFEGVTPAVTLESDRRWLTRAIKSLVTSASRRGPLGGGIRLRAEHIDHHIRIVMSSPQLKVWPLEENGSQQTTFGIVGPSDRGDLGLSLSRKIVALHGGKLALHVSEEEGAAAVIELPAPRSREPSRPSR